MGERMREREALSRLKRMQSLLEVAHSESTYKEQDKMIRCLIPVVELVGEICRDESWTEEERESFDEYEVPPPDHVLIGAFRYKFRNIFYRLKQLYPQLIFSDHPNPEDDDRDYL